MLTVTCPNCRHQFPGPGCCKPIEDTNRMPEEEKKKVVNVVHPTTCYLGGFLMPHSYPNGGTCFINTSTIIHEPAIYQSNTSHCGDNSTRIASFDPGSLTSSNNHRTLLEQIQHPFLRTQTIPLNNSAPYIVARENIEHSMTPSRQTLATTCEFTGNNFRITTPGIQSGGCVIQSTDAGILVQTPHIEIRPKLTGGGCLVQERISSDDKQLTMSNYPADIAFVENAHSLFIRPLPSGCSELPGNRGTMLARTTEDNDNISKSKQQRIPNTAHANDCCNCNNSIQTLCQCHERSSANMTCTDNRDSLLLESVGREREPAVPMSWLMPYPWNLDAYPLEKAVNRLQEVKRTLQICGWYHEGISWQQSESLLKDRPVGHWLMRDSSDSRYTFAVSVQTARGPTSVRVLYFFGRFRLDAEPRLALTMPLFDCPISMLKHYMDYSKRMDEHRREVWVDYSGQLHSQIYLTKPLIKEVRSLSHLARLAVNRNNLSTEHLPLLIRNYLAEYPHTI